MAKNHLHFFLEKYRNKSEDNYNNIYWKGIGQACNKLSDTENITIKENLNGWFNMGQQKGHFG